MMSGSRISAFLSASTDCDDDLERVAVADHGARVRAPGHDLAVSLDGDLLAGKLKPGEQRRDLQGVLEAVRLAVHSHLNHRRIILEPLLVPLLKSLVFTLDNSTLRPRPPPQPRPAHETHRYEDREGDRGEHEQGGEEEGAEQD